MSPAAGLAALAAALAVFAVWDAVAAVERARLTAAVGRLVAPLLRAGREGREPSAPERRRLALVATVVLLAGGWLLGGPLTGLGVAVAGPWAAVTAVRARRRRYRSDLRGDAPLIARSLADALAGGHSVRGAVAEVARAGGLTGPAALELSVAARRLELGEPTAAVLEQLQARAGVRAFDTIVAAVLVQARAGGDLAGLLRELAVALEDATRLDGEARAATAQARFTGLLVSVLPLGAAALAELASPGYLASLLAAPLTAWLLGCAAVLQLAALVVISRIARVAR